MVSRQALGVQDQRQILPQGDANGCTTRSPRLGDALKRHALEPLGLERLFQGADKTHQLGVACLHTGNWRCDNQ